MRAGSLFSGGGGLDLAVEALFPDVEWAWHAENDKDAVAVHAARWPGVPNLGDLSAVVWASVEPVDLLVGGYPCQPWSTAGKRKGQDDARDGWPWFRDAISDLRPGLVMLENVRGHVVPAGAGRTVGDLADLGYDCRWTTLRASDVGAPHRRERWFCVAVDTERGGRDGWGTGQPSDTGDTGKRRFGWAEGASTDAAAAAGDRWDERRSGSTQRARGGGQFASDQRATADPDGVVGEERGALEGRSESVDQPGSLERTVGLCGVRTEWGKYGSAIARWEAVLGRDAPEPTVTGGRLSPRFVEWMMGWPQGHTGGVSRSAALRILGNGVVPQQAVAAYRPLLADAVEVAV